MSKRRSAAIDWALAAESVTGNYYAVGQFTAAGVTTHELIEWTGAGPSTRIGVLTDISGGLDYVYTCPTRMSIPSSGERIAVPLSVDSFPATVFYEATPALKEVAYLKAEVQNSGKNPILAGTVNIFMGPDFAGQGRLATTGPGGKLSLPLGADENIRLKRTIVPKTETEGVFSKDDITTYTVTIEVGNYKKRRVEIAIFDQVPKSGNEEIEIEMGKLSPKPVKGPDHDGIMRWELDIPAGKMSKIEFKYKIERPENWQLHQ